MLAELDICVLDRAVDRSLIFQCERGKTDYRLTDTTFGFNYRKNVTVRMNVG
jgi:hypothetical protein